MPLLWSCGVCGAATEVPERHRAWHRGEPIVLQAAKAATAFRCLACQTLVLHRDIHIAWHAHRGDAPPPFEDGALVG